MAVNHDKRDRYPLVTPRKGFIVEKDVELKVTDESAAKPTPRKIRIVSPINNLVPGSINIIDDATGAQLTDVIELHLGFFAHDGSTIVRLVRENSARASLATRYERLQHPRYTIEDVELVSVTIEPKTP